LEWLIEGENWTNYIESVKFKLSNITMFTNHTMKLQTIPFNKIKNGEKIIESRLYDEKRQKIRTGDVIKFQQEPNLENTIKIEVVALLNYKNFSDLMSDFSPESFGGNSKKELLEKIHQFYSKEDEKKYSVVGIKLKLLE